jgi:UDP-N-acetylglucosamine--N-acetylmuramyl-(pentapeptide) pyrophosphoryl-undecaprenol N-acetylglucosamine transferase
MLMRASTAWGPVEEATGPGSSGQPDASGRGDGPTLLVASTGGHLEQLTRWRALLGTTLGPCEWATFDSPQSRALLRDETVHFVGYIKPRDYAAVARDLPSAMRVMATGGYSAVISTGAGIALPFFLAAGIYGVPRYYVESAARSMGPSLTGRLVGQIPGTRLFTQYPDQAKGRWSYCGSLFDSFEKGDAADAPVGPGRSPQRVVVTLGTMPGYGFRRAVERLLRLLPEVCAADVEVLWQTGATDLTGLGVTGCNQVPANELREAIQHADLVVGHGGIGSALNSLDAGRVPVMVPRRVAYGEHVDDHQVLICDYLDKRGIAVAKEVDELDACDLWRAAHSSAHATTNGNVALLSLPGVQRRSHRGRLLSAGAAPVGAAVPGWSAGRARLTLNQDKRRRFDSYPGSWLSEARKRVG